MHARQMTGIRHDRAHRIHTSRTHTQCTQHAHTYLAHARQRTRTQFREPRRIRTHIHSLGASAAHAVHTARAHSFAPPHTHAREHNTVSAHPRHMPHTAHALIHIAGLGGLFIHFSTDSHDWVARTERRRLHFPTCMLKHLRTWHARFSKHSSTS